MLTNAATLGAMSAVKRLDPVKDELKASEVRTWLGNDSKMSRKSVRGENLVGKRQ